MREKLLKRRMYKSLQLLAILSLIVRNLKKINEEMIQKILLLLCSIALASAGVIGTEYSPATSVSYSSISPHLIKTISNPSVEKTVTTPIGYTKIIQSPPVYQTVLTTKENNYDGPDGTQHATYTKSFDTAYSSLNKFESESPKSGDLIANTIPGIYSTAVHSPVVYHPGAAYTVSSPLVHTIHTPTKSVSNPISYTTHDIPLTKTIVSPASYSTPVFDKTKFVTSGLSSYSSHAPIIESQPIKTTITYSEAPLVSHMSFTGLGTSYAW